MKRILYTFLLIMFSVPALAQQSDSTSIRLSVDSCTLAETVMNSSTREFRFNVKNSSPIYTLFKSGNKEIGFKCYVNRIIEDGQQITIVKSIFLEKQDGEWNELSKGDYSAAKRWGNQVSIKSGSNKPVPDFFISYTLSVMNLMEDKNDAPFESGTPAAVPASKKDQ